MKDNEKDQELLNLDKPIKTKAKSTRRLNNKPLIIILSIAVAFLVVFMIALNDTSKRREQQSATQSTSNVKEGSDERAISASFAKDLLAGKESGVIASGDIPSSGSVKNVPPPVPPQNIYNQDMPEIPVTTTGEREMPPIAVTKSADVSETDKYEQDRIRQIKAEMFENAVKGKSAVPVDAMAFSSVGGSGTKEEALAQIQNQRAKIKSATSTTDSYQAKLDMLRNSGIIDGLSDSNDAPSPGAYDFGQSTNNSMMAYSSQDWYLQASEPDKPRTPYEIRTGAVMPATMISGINSEIPGQIIGQVSQNVYDTATGKHLIIPQGTRIIGEYSSDVGYGQTRVLIAWHRLIFPDGRALDLGNMPGVDQSGYGGFADKVNNHYFRTISSAILLSGIIAGVELSQDNDNNNTNSRRANDALSEALGQTLGNTLAEIIKKNMNIAPTIEIRPGYRFNVMVVKDISFIRPYSK